MYSASQGRVTKTRADDGDEQDAGFEGDMSVFSDFQAAWGSRFPGCELPKAWEDDVRGNLAKHRQKASHLRNELEKEEFYVEYLERLLADVERVVRRGSSTLRLDKPGHPATQQLQGSSVGPLTGSGASPDGVSMSASPSEDTTSLPPSSNHNHKEPSNGSSGVGSASAGGGDQYVTVITVSSYGEIQKPEPPRAAPREIDSGLIDNPLYQDVQASNHAKNWAKTTTAENESPVDSNKIREDCNGRARTGSGSVTHNIKHQTAAALVVAAENKGKKRPPTPPRKPKIDRNNFPGLQFIGKENFGNAVIPSPTPPSAPGTPSSELDAPACLPIITGAASEVVAIKPAPTKPMIPAAHAVIVPEEPAYAVRLLSEIERGSCHSPTSEVQSTHRTENGNRFVAKSEDEEELDDASVNGDLSLHGVTDAERDTEEVEDDEVVEDEEEAIYDTVAPDDARSLDSGLHAEEIDINNLNKLEKDRDSSASNLSSAKFSDINSFANYVNIDYFLRRDETSSKNDSDDNETQTSRSVHSSDHEIDVREEISREGYAKVGAGNHNRDREGHSTYDEVFHDPDLYGAYYGVVESEDPSPLHALQEKSKAGGDEPTKAEADRLTMYKYIISSISESETAYVDCLNTLLQYMKAIKSTIGTNHPLVSPEDLNVMFYKIPDLHSIHCTFLSGLTKLASERAATAALADGEPPATLGDLFKNLASRLGAYSAYLKNYSRALETVQKCSAENNQFSEITRAIKLKATKGQATTLEELLHKPVARVQKNALVLHDLLKYTPESHQEYKSLKTALKMTQCFLNDLNIAATEQMFPVQDKTQRRLVKESFIIESVEKVRKLRHLFLFNDIIVCAKYRPSTRQKFTFDVKWYAMLCDISLPESEESTTISTKEREMNTEIMSLKSRVSSLRDGMAKEEKGKANNKTFDKLKKKQADLEGQLVLLLPQLPLQLVHKSGKSYSFFLASEYERTQWIESVKVLQQTASSSGPPSGEHINFNELQAWIETCRKGLNPNLGSFLLRTSKDEELLHGDLYLEIRSLKGLSRPADLFFVVEVDMYGHFFQKACTRVARETLEPRYDQEFVLDLDGSQTLRILCYEEVPGHPKALFRGKATIELSRTWVTDRTTEKDISMLDSTLSIKVKFVSSEASTIRFPAGKVYGSFGSNIQTVCKKEKSAIPYLIIGCVREVERRGMKELGIYRVSGLTSDIQKLRRAFENNPYEAEHLLKDIDIHAVTGLLKLYLRDLPEALFTNNLYKKFFDAFSLQTQEEKKRKLVALYAQLPQVNQNTITFLIEHLANVNQFESHNKMSLNNLATVFGPTMIRPGANSVGSTLADQFTAGTIDVMAQAGILYFFLQSKVNASETAC